MVLEKTLESPLHCKEIQPVHSKGDQFWMFIGRTDAEAETPVLWPPHAELTHWKRLWCWEGWGAGREGDNRGWDGWMASPTWWTWVWVNSGSWWWTGRPGMLQFMGSQRVGQDWATELNWTELNNKSGMEWELRPGLLNSQFLALFRSLDKAGCGKESFLVLEKPLLNWTWVCSSVWQTLRMSKVNQMYYEDLLSLISKL